MHQLTLQIPPWLFLQGKPTVGLGAHSFVPKEWKFQMFLSHPTTVLLSSSPAASAPLPGWEIQCVRPRWAGGNRTWLRVELFVWLRQLFHLAGSGELRTSLPRDMEGRARGKCVAQEPSQCLQGGRQI